MKMGCLIADILTKVLQKCSLSAPLQNIPFFNLVGYYGNPKKKFLKKYSKDNCLEAVWDIKLKLWRIVSNNSLYKKHLLPLLKYFGCYGNLKIPLTYNGKSENWDLLLYLTVDILTKVLQKSSIKHMNFVQTTEFDWLPWQPKG